LHSQPAAVGFGQTLSEGNTDTEAVDPATFALRPDKHSNEPVLERVDRAAGSGTWS
jgi:hypothetical protein